MMTISFQEFQDKIGKLRNEYDALRKDLNEWFDKLKEDNPEKHDEVEELGVSFYHRCITDGEPRSFGNATDCYDDGFDMGYKQGRLELLEEMFGEK